MENIYGKKCTWEYLFIYGNDDRSTWEIKSIPWKWKYSSTYIIHGDFIMLPTRAA